MTTPSKDFQAFLDTQQYSKKGILVYEKIFGRTFVSTGGAKTTTELCDKHLGDHLRPGMKVLDVGCGIGGSAFHMARQYGVDVYGVDLSTNMVNIANDVYRRQMEPAVQHRVQFHVDDATRVQYPDAFYDVVYSRDTILHIEDKLSLFKKFHGCLKPGGKLLISDYCRGDQEHSEAFKAYVAQRGYHLLTVAGYGKCIEDAGFGRVEAIDNTKNFIEILETELASFAPLKEEVISEYSEKEFEGIVNGWSDKVKRCEAGDQVWGIFVAKKLFN